ncbi:3' terminal RNA ribose 2'-O-methyltransferase Hen1 [Streptomyces sp. SID11385]|uniref:3' terminal RNA ribose 2'-O-methyltransferase Hen1 n=1 Tax=Streptomyces sp. SID11385 TaxID=2706031 RepID=UPI0013CB2ADE|nr:3' terminal RNA ribose 2'-O-methyltransferase Hen1 [Streptomyces sp. SID11385]NEA42356.1 3' terminal RNA ribose 2'-O-methyltransferase Hen1 [Streptomyces sp. SID11385]
MTLTTTGTPEAPASDLGFLLHKHPGRAQRFDTAHGTAHVFYPEAGAERCSVALLLEIDPVALVRRGKRKGRGKAPDASLAQYVNDRPYAASSLFTVALGTVFKTALHGECKARPELAGRALPLRIELPAVPANGDPDLVERLFAPLGWTVTAEAVPLDPAFPEWGDSRYVRLVLEGEQVLAEALRHLYVLLPVLDGTKHYWASADEVDKLLRAGEGWLPAHPEQAYITRRYLSYRFSLTRDAMERLELLRLAESDDTGAENIDNAVEDGAEDASEAADGTENVAGTEDAADGTENVAGTEDEAAAGLSRPVTLAFRRRAAILEALRAANATRVLDLGCGEGTLVKELLKDARFTHVLGMDVSQRALQIAARRLRVDRMPERQAARLTLVQGSLAYTDPRLAGYDAAVLSEVIEHVDPPRLATLAYTVFGAARPATVVVTTPNAEYNVRWETLPAGHVRHHDHRFEWDRAQFRSWAEEVAAAYGYTVTYGPVGDEDPEVGPPTQLARFTRTDTTTSATDTTTKEGAAA